MKLMETKFTNITLEQFKDSGWFAGTASQPTPKFTDPNTFVLLEEDETLL